MKLSCLEKILVVATLLIGGIVFVGKFEKIIFPYGASKESKIIEVKNKVIESDLGRMSLRLEKSYDDMKELTYYFAPVGEDMRVVVTPYVVVDKNYNPTLCEHLQYFGSHIIRFDTLYVKSASQVSSFSYSGAETVSYNSEGYSGVMKNEVYLALKAAVESGYARVRMEGKAGTEEKELSQKEIEGIKAVFEIYEYLGSMKVVD